MTTSNVPPKSIDGKHTPTYQCYRDMIRRCYDPRRPEYKNYGGRGITVCDRWRESYGNFYADMGEKPDGLFSR